MFIFVIKLYFKVGIMDRVHISISVRHFSGLSEYNYEAHIRRPGLRPWRRHNFFFMDIFNKHIGGAAADFRPKAGICAYSCYHPRPNMADQNCNLGNDP